jgi:predicted dehydrogenase
MHRRHFLASSSAAALALAADRSPVRAEVGRPLRVGLVGCGWYGMVNLRNLLTATKGNRDVEVVALADPDTRQLAAAVKDLPTAWKVPAPATHQDFREALKPGALDVAIVGSPDHWHALHAIAAMKAGADVYCEKPTCHTIDEGKAMVATAAKLKRVVQVGTQRRSTPHVIRAKEFIRSGKLGHVGQVKCCCFYNMRPGGNPPDRQPPAELDWDMWCGPAPLVPYNPIYHPKTWRGFNAFSNGIVGDMFVHMLDTARFVLGFCWPHSVSSAGGIYVQKAAKADIPDTQSIELDYGDMTLTWDHRTYGPADDPKYPWAVCFYGEKGAVKLDVDKWEFVPHGGGKPVLDKADLMPELANKDQPANIVPGGLGHMKDFLECVGTRKPPVANIAEGHVSTATCLLGNVALRVGRTLTWDAAAGKVVEDNDANALLRRAYRKPWVYPEA